ncbi:hypothetical protein C8Q76DRAFT_856075 [Earliella scabrosa]|nr:hypothetical protein C8Q76DRAFT_856075 [Earliella scabrosa]
MFNYVGTHDLDETVSVQQDDLSHAFAINSSIATRYAVQRHLAGNSSVDVGWHQGVVISHARGMRDNPPSLFGTNSANGTGYNVEHKLTDNSSVDVGWNWSATNMLDPTLSPPSDTFDKACASLANFKRSCADSFPEVAADLHGILSALGRSSPTPPPDINFAGTDPPSDCVSPADTILSTPGLTCASSESGLSPGSSETHLPSTPISFRLPPPAFRDEGRFQSYDAGRLSPPAGHSTGPPSEFQPPPFCISPADTLHNTSALAQLPPQSFYPGTYASCAAGYAGVHSLPPPYPHPVSTQPHPLPAVAPDQSGVERPTSTLIHQTSSQPFKSPGQVVAPAFICDICCQGFGYKRNLTTHMKEQHNPDFQGFACDIPNCDRSYNRRNDLVRHKAKHHPDSEAPTQHLRGTFGVRSMWPALSARTRRLEPSSLDDLNPTRPPGSPTHQAPNQDRTRHLQPHEEEEDAECALDQDLDEEEDTRRARARFRPSSDDGSRRRVRAESAGHMLRTPNVPRSPLSRLAPLAFALSIPS